MTCVSLGSWKSKLVFSDIWRCHQKVSPEDATRRCHQKMSPEHDTKICHQQMSPDLLVWLNNCTRYHQSWLLPYKNWCWLNLKMAVLNIIFLKPCWPMFFPQVCFLTSHFSSFVGCKFFIEPPWQAFSRLVQHYIVCRPLVTSTDLIFDFSSQFSITWWRKYKNHPLEFHMSQPF